MDAPKITVRAWCQDTTSYVFWDAVSLDTIETDYPTTPEYPPFNTLSDITFRYKPGPIGPTGPSGADGGGGSDSLIYRPFGQSDVPNHIYTDWSELMIARAAIASPVTVYIDYTGIDYMQHPYGVPIPAGQWDMFNISLQGFITNSDTGTYVSRDVSLINLNTIKDLTVSFDARYSSDSAISYQTCPPILKLDMASLVRVDTYMGGTPINISQLNFDLYLENSKLINNSQGSEAGPLIKAGSSGIINVYCSQGSSVGDNTLQNAGDYNP